MASTFGLIDTGSGFNKKTTADVLSELETSQKADIRNDLDVSAEGPVGQLNGTFAGQLGEAWDVLQDIHTARDPNNAEGAAQDSLGAITGAFRLAASPAKLNANNSNPLTLTGTPATLVPALDQARVSAGIIFETDDPATILVVSTWVTLTAYVVGDRVTLGGQVYEATVAGTSGATGPVGVVQAVIEVDATVSWINVGVGTGAVDVDATAIVDEAAGANANTVLTIITPESGWLSVINLNDAIAGTNIEGNEAFRIRREALLRQTGKATLEAIRAAALAVTGAIEAFVFENTTLVTDGAGVPGKAFEVVIEGGTDADIRQVIFDTKPIGIQAFGSVSGSVVDSQGNSHTIEFSRPTTLAIVMSITVVTDGNYPANGDTQVKNALKAKGDLLGIGDDVIAEVIKCEALAIAGVVDITAFALVTGSPNIAITNRQLATFDTSDITVTS